jgi:DNA-binding CsgD family transcriptional regulator
MLVSPMLTVRETQCLTLVAEGLTDDQAAGRLGIKARTQRFHIANALVKLDARTRAHGVALAIRLGLLSPPPETTEPEIAHPHEQAA